MGRALVAAANVNPLQLPISHSQGIIPQITMRLTRLDPDAEPNEPRIKQTIQCLVDMGIDVQLGERTQEEIPLVKPNTAPHPSSLVFEPSTSINVDLSVLIALVSDLTHALLPATIDEANTRFIPPERYLEWKRKVNATKAKAKKLIDPDFNDEDFEMSLPAQQDMAKTSRALTNQILQEMGKGLLQEIADRLGVLDIPLEKVEFWTTQEARDRCLRIVSKVGGTKEKRRAQALLFDPRGAAPAVESELDPDFLLAPPDTLEGAEEVYWGGSRYAHKFLPFIPLRFYPTSSSLSAAGSDSFQSVARPTSTSQLSPPSTSLFFRSLNSTCSDILAYEKHSRSNGGPRALKGNFGLGPSGPNSNSNRVVIEGDSILENGNEAENEPEWGANNLSFHSTPTPASPSMPRATVTKANPRLTAHTVQSLQWGSQLGWTTLTANRTSVKAIVKEINARARVEMFEDAFAMNGPLGGAVGVDDVSSASSSSSPGSGVLQTSTSAAAQDSDAGVESDMKVGGDVGSTTRNSAPNLKAAIWIIDPRSLAEGMRADSVDDLDRD